MPAGLPMAATAGLRRYWLLDLRVAGRSLRLSSAPVSVAKADGTILEYQGGLSDISYEIERLAGADEAEPVNVPVRVLVPGVDWAALRSKGHDLSAGVAELAEWAPGILWERRRRLVVGAVTEPTFGPAGTALEFSITMDPGSDSVLVPSALAVVDASTWPDAHEDAEGKTCPLVFGAPGEYRTAGGSTVTTSGTRGLLIKQGYDATVLLACHRVEAEKVWLFDDAGNSESFAVTHIYDGRGRLCAVADISSSASLVRDQGIYWVGWKRGAGWGGGMLGRHGRAMYGAGEIVRWFLSQTSMRVDLAQVDSVASELDRYVLGFGVGSPVEPYDFVAQEILPYLPASPSLGPDGIELHLVRFGRVRAALSTDGGLVRVGNPQLDRPAAEVLSEIRCEYAIRAREDTARRQLVLTPAPGEVGDDAVPTWRAGESYRHYRGTRNHQRRPPPVQAERLSLRVFYDRPSVARVARHRLVEDAFVPELVSYWDPHRMYDHIREGHTVTIEDPEAGLDGARARVERVEESNFRRTFRLRLRTPIGA